MLKFAMRHGLVRLIGGRAVPLMWAWDVAVLANKARRIPVVDRDAATRGRCRRPGSRHGRDQPALGDASRPAPVRRARKARPPSDPTRRRRAAFAPTRIALRTPC